MTYSKGTPKTRAFIAKLAKAQALQGARVNVDCFQGVKLTRDLRERLGEAYSAACDGGIVFG